MDNRENRVDNSAQRPSSNKPLGLYAPGVVKPLGSNKPLGSDLTAQDSSSEAAGCAQPVQITPDQWYLLQRLQERDEGWMQVTAAVVVKANKTYGRGVVHTALQRLREEDTVPENSGVALLNAVCEAVKGAADGT